MRQRKESVSLKAEVALLSERVSASVDERKQLEEAVSAAAAKHAEEEAAKAALEQSLGEATAEVCVCVFSQWCVCVRMELRCVCVVLGLPFEGAS